MSTRTDLEARRIQHSVTSLTFITGNRIKFEEVAAIIPGVKQLDLDLPELQEIDPQKIIAAKLETALSRDVFPVIVEDTSLYLKALNGLPGPLVKWFLKALGTEGLYRLAETAGESAAEARTVIGLAGNDGKYLYFEGSVSGRVVRPRGEEFGWNTIFLPAGSERTFGEMSNDERLHWSMRKAAAEKLKAALGI